MGGAKGRLGEDRLKLGLEPRRLWPLDGWRGKGSTLGAGHGVAAYFFGLFWWRALDGANRGVYTCVQLMAELSLGPVCRVHE